MQRRGGAPLSDAEGIKIGPAEERPAWERRYSFMAQEVEELSHAPQNLAFLNVLRWCAWYRGEASEKSLPLLQKAKKNYQQQSIVKISFRFSTTDGFGWLWTNMSRPQEF